MFGEAAMFTAQLAGPQQTKAGMNSDYAEQNYQLLLNIIHWLDGKPDNPSNRRPADPQTLRPPYPKTTL
jgi:hypothetical protein